MHSWEARVGVRSPGRLRVVNPSTHAEAMKGLRCASCGETIGVYERTLVILPDGSERAGSRLTLDSELEDLQRVALHHERCRRSSTDWKGQQDAPGL